MLKSKTLILFFIGGALIVGEIIYSIINTSLGMSLNNKVVGLITTFAFGLSLAGLIIGVGEIKKTKNLKNWIGVIGNSVVMAFFFWVIMVAIQL